MQAIAGRPIRQVTQLNLSEKLSTGVKTATVLNQLNDVSDIDLKKIKSGPERHPCTMDHHPLPLTGLHGLQPDCLHGFCTLQLFFV